MSATPNNAGAGWSGSSTPIKAPTSLPGSECGQNALQALLAFACIHQQASSRRQREAGKKSAAPAQLISAEEQFALDEVLHLVAERAVSITGADGVAIALADNEAIICRASFGRIAPDPGIKLDPNAGFSGACLRSGKTVRCDDSEVDVRVNAAVCRALGARSMIAVPLSAKQRVIGLIEAFSTEPYGFNDGDVRSLNLLGELILAAIRPEEEDRLAELAARVVIPMRASPGPMPAPPVSLESQAAGGPTAGQPTATPSPAAVASKTAAPLIPEPIVPVRGKHAPAALADGPRVIVDEKFAPEPGREGLPKAEAAVSALATSGQEEATATAASEPAPLPEAVAITSQSAAHHRLLAISGIAALVLLAIGLAVAVGLKIRHDEQAISANTQPAVVIKTGDTEREILLPAPAEVNAGPAPEITGLRQWSSGDSSTVVVDLEDQVQYEAQRLENPPRIYFDLHDTKISPALATKSIDVNGPLLKHVRMAQPVDGVTRVVLDTAPQAQFSVSLDPNPYRLTIEVHKPTADTTVAAVLPATLAKPSLPKPSPIVASPKKSPAQPVAQKELQIVLDAGHGGWDLGTVGKKGLLEKDLTLDITQRLGKLVEDNLGARVVYTRQDDSYVPLEKRAEIANLAGADLFLSVHANYSDLSTARGVETYYSNTYSSIKARTPDDDPALKQINWMGVDIRAKVTDSHKLAADVQQALCGTLVAMNPELRNRGVKRAQYVVLTGTQMPAVLAEVSFVSSPEEEDHLRSAEYRQRIAEALYRGIAKYREELKPKNTKLASAKKPAR